jgi:hypothetical protein
MGIRFYLVLTPPVETLISRHYSCSFYFFFYSLALHPQFGPWPTSMKFHFGFLDLRQSVGLLGREISSSQGIYLYTNTQTLKICALSGFRTHDPGLRANEDSACLRPHDYRDRSTSVLHPNILLVTFIRSL